MWQAQILTLFPEMFPGPLGLSLAGKALDKKLWSMDVMQIRDHALDKHRSVDAPPFGGGPGMVMRADIMDRAIDAAQDKRPDGVSDDNWPLIYLSPRGKKLDQEMVHDFAGKKGITLICGRFEGLDERVLEKRKIQEVSLGDFVLSGGELAALMLMDAVVRLIPGVIGEPDTLQEESFTSGLLEYPQYTRPQMWEGLEVPDVLLSGHHEKIKKWRQAQSENLTKERRPDLWKKYSHNKSDD
ncbi:MAG: tRNA (guanosine(37)-N1)-methyltransferase TrmD [Emcibacteraceae bacterium]|nr:tRNA (guanosine(37)-N1)-methyltransferase TrmD [Emcibacteraceae bacterium]